MAFFNSAIIVLQIFVVALNAGLGVWGIVSLLKGYSSDNLAQMRMYGKEAKIRK